jgi:hypothetical protein
MAQFPHTGGERGIVPDWRAIGITRRLEVHDHTALSLMAVWFLVGETHRGQSLTPALTLPQVRYGLSLLLLAVFCPLGVDDICRRVQRQLQRNESARFGIVSRPNLLS